MACVMVVTYGRNVLYTRLYLSSLKYNNTKNVVYSVIKSCVQFWYTFMGLCEAKHKRKSFIGNRAGRMIV